MLPSELHCQPDLNWDIPAINSMVKAVKKTACHPFLYNGPPQRHSGGPRYTIVFSSTILLTRLLYPPINTVGSKVLTFYIK